MNLQTARGVVENLNVGRTKQHILYGPQMREAAGVSALVFAFSGMAGAATQTASGADGGADDVAMYSFHLDGSCYAGCTRAVSFKNGDEVEVIFEERTQGNEVLAVRRPATRTIWLYPYMARGTWAGIIHALKLWILSSAALTIFIGLIGIGYATKQTMLLLAVLSPAGIALVTSWMLPRLLRFSRAANEVFAALGYEKPEWVDLPATSKKHRRANRIPWTAKNALELWY